MSSRRLFLKPTVACIVVGAVAVASAACSSSSSPASRAYIDSQLSTAQAFAGACNVTDPEWVTIGTSHQPADDGSSQSNGTVQVNCTVSSNPDGTFNVIASAVAQGAGGGSITITSTQGHPWSTSGQQTNVRATFQRGDTGNFSESDCTVTYDDQDGVKVGVAAGRVGGSLDCPMVQDSTQQRPNPDGGANIPRTCHAVATFRFENCSQ